MIPKLMTMTKLIATTFLLGLIGIGAQSAFADLIDFEAGFADLQPVGVVVTPTNTVTFGVGPSTGSTGPGFIAMSGLPITAYAPGDAIPGPPVVGFFLTDETMGPNLIKDYFISFAVPTTNLSLDLYDYRGDGGAGVGATATLDVFDARGINIGSTSFTVPAGAIPDPNREILSIPAQRRDHRRSWQK